MPDPRVHDNDRDEITVTLDGKEVRGWSYENEAERRVKMLAAREFCEGWFQAVNHLRDAADNAAEAAYLDRQQSLMESGGPDDSAYRRDMIQAGRGHLVGR
jgi:hypothetical protein